MVRCCDLHYIFKLEGNISFANLDFDSLSVLSEESLMDQSPVSPYDCYPMLNLSEGSKQSMINSSKSAVELRFLQQILWEAGEEEILN